MDKCHDGRESRNRVRIHKSKLNMVTLKYTKTAVTPTLINFAQMFPCLAIFRRDVLSTQNTWVVDRIGRTKPFLHACFSIRGQIETPQGCREDYEV